MLRSRSNDHETDSRVPESHSGPASRPRDHSSARRVLRAEPPIARSDGSRRSARKRRGILRGHGLSPPRSRPTATPRPLRRREPTRFARSRESTRRRDYQCHPTETRDAAPSSRAATASAPGAERRAASGGLIGREASARFVCQFCTSTGSSDDEGGTPRECECDCLPKDLLPNPKRCRVCYHDLRRIDPYQE